MNVLWVIFCSEVKSRKRHKIYLKAVKAKMDIFEVPVLLLKLIGFWRHPKYYRLLQLAQAFVILNLCFGIFTQILSIPVAIPDFMEAAIAFAPELTACMSLCKGMILVVSLDKFYSFIKKINDLSSGEISSRLLHVSF